VKWFKHDSDANADAKLKKLRHKHGITGFGLYWYCLELIAGTVDKTNIKFELEEDFETIAKEWGLDEVTVLDVISYMVELELFENNGKSITCFKLALRLDDTNAKNPEIKSVIKSIGRRKSESVGVTPSNSDQIRLDKTRIDKIKKITVDESTEPKKRKVFRVPTSAEVYEYMLEKGFDRKEESEKFCNFYESKGWAVGKTKMKNWKAAASNWISRSGNFAQQKPVSYDPFEESEKEDWTSRIQLK
jgi:hypothetical protein